jgi:methionyl-tRNA formyltransferase
MVARFFRRWWSSAERGLFNLISLIRCCLIQFLTLDRVNGYYQMTSYEHVHLYSTDVLSLELIRILAPRFKVVALVVPANRMGTKKVADLIAISNLPVVIHEQNSLCSSISSVPKASHLISFAYSQIINASLLSCYSGGGLNFHGGRIPEYRGANVLNWALAAGERTLWATWHKLETAIDSGGIYGEAQFALEVFDTAETCRVKLSKLALSIFPESWNRFVGKKEPLRIPNLNEGRVWPQRRKSDSRVEENRPREHVEAMVLAQSSDRFPPAYYEFQNNRYAVLSVEDNQKGEYIPYQTDDGETLWLRVKQIL